MEGKVGGDCNRNFSSPNQVQGSGTFFPTFGHHTVTFIELVLARLQYL